MHLSWVRVMCAFHSWRSPASANYANKFVTQKIESVRNFRYLAVSEYHFLWPAQWDFFPIGIWWNDKWSKKWTPFEIVNHTKNEEKQIKIAIWHAREAILLARSPFAKFLASDGGSDTMNSLSSPKYVRNEDSAGVFQSEKCQSIVDLESRYHCWQSVLWCHWMGRINKI